VKVWNRSALHLVLTALALAAWWVCGPLLPGPAGRSPEEEDESHLSSRLDGRLEAIRRSIQIKEETTGRYLAGELTLEEAAGIFRDATDVIPGHEVIVLGYFAGDTREEKLCRHVLAWVGAVLIQDPDNGGYIAYLEAEFDERLRTQGPPVLPPPASTARACAASQGTGK
jgi:hypothetical protein